MNTRLLSDRMRGRPNGHYWTHYLPMISVVDKGDQWLCRYRKRAILMSKQDQPTQENARRMMAVTMQAVRAE